MLVSFTFEIDDKIKDKIEAMAKPQERSIAGQLRLILDEYFEKKRWYPWIQNDI